MTIKINASALAKCFTDGKIDIKEAGKLAKEYGLKESDIKNCKSAWDLEKMIKNASKSE